VLPDCVKRAIGSMPNYLLTKYRPVRFQTTK
jgi:hypothetical protein